MNTLVDTSVWSLALRRKAQDLSTAKEAAVAELGELIREGRARMIGLVRQELLSSIKTQAQTSGAAEIAEAQSQRPVLGFSAPACVQFVRCAGIAIARKLEFSPWQKASPKSSPRAARGL